MAAAVEVAEDHSDLVICSFTQQGDNTAASCSFVFDGSDVGLTANGEDIGAVAFDSAGDMLFSTVGTWSASGATGQDEDVGRFGGTFGSATSGTPSLELDLTALGISANEDIDGISFR